MTNLKCEYNEEIGHYGQTLSKTQTLMGIANMYIPTGIGGWVWQIKKQ